MSAETLHRAAALMRDRATHPDLCSAAGPHCVSQTHNVPWHPAVALAVADLLDSAAEAFGDIEAWRGTGVIESVPVEFHALAVAHAYLGSEQ